MERLKAASVSKQSTPASGVLQRKCSGCKKKEKEKARLQRSAVRSGPVGEMPPIVHEVLRSPGRPLDAETRNFMESRFSHDFSQVRPNATPQAASLKIGQANDRYEQEADQVAEHILQMPDSHMAKAVSAGQDKIFMQQNCNKCREGNETKQNLLMEVPQSDSIHYNVHPVVYDVLHSPGQPLDPETRIFFEQRFGSDFGHVRIHTDFNAGESAKAMDAMAYTVGTDIVFGNGQYAPESGSGRRLLAHELAHVVQQQGQRGDAHEPSHSLFKLSIGHPMIQMQQSQPQKMAVDAANHAESMRTQSNPKIWFDSWNNDERDNNGNHKYDNQDPDEMKWKDKDGHHYNGGGTWYEDAWIKTGFFIFYSNEYIVPRNTVMYKVCVDIVNESYKSAGYTKFGGIRGVGKLEKYCDASSDFKTWRGDRSENYPDLLAGDIITYKTNKHSHSGIVGPNGSIIHLPGPSNWVYFNKTNLNDMVETYQTTWSVFFGITQVSRLISSGAKKPPGGKRACLDEGNFPASTPIETRARLSQDSDYFGSQPEAENGGPVFNVYCPPGQVCVSGNCQPPEVLPKENLEIQFNKDAPQWWYDSASSFKVSLTPEGHAAFEELVAKMESQPTLRVQLEGHASSDRPANDESYNRRLTDRRARLIASELEKRGIPRSRLDRPADESGPSGCEEIDTESARGLLSCSDEGAKVPPDPSDRKVVASLFQ